MGRRRQFRREDSHGRAKCSRPRRWSRIDWGEEGKSVNTARGPKSTDFQGQLRQAHHRSRLLQSNLWYERRQGKRLLPQRCWRRPKNKKAHSGDIRDGCPAHHDRQSPKRPLTLCYRRRGPYRYGICCANLRSDPSRHAQALPRSDRLRPNLPLRRRSQSPPNV